MTVHRHILELAGVVAPLLLVQVATGDTLYRGLPHTAQGAATLTLQADGLQVSNLGSSGEDGVAIDLPQAAGWEAHWQPLDPTGAMPIDAYLKSEVRGTAGTVTGGLLGYWKLTKADAGRYAVTADFAPLGASTVTLMVYHGTTLATTLTGQSGALAEVNGCVDDDHWGQPTGGPFGLPGRFGGALTFIHPCTFTFGDGSAALGDRLVILPEGGATVSALSEARLLASGIPQITLDEERVIQRYAGLAHGSLGQASLVKSGTVLTVGNIGSSGQDGVEIQLGLSGPRKFDLFYHIPEGDGALIFTGHGSTATQPDQPLGIATIDYVGTTETLSFDYTPVGAATYTLRIYNGKQLVHESPNHSGPSVERLNDRFPYRKLPLDDWHMGWYEDGPDEWNGTFWVPTTIYHPGYMTQTSQETSQLRVIGGPTVSGDLVLAIPESPTSSATAASRATIQASGAISSLDIHAEAITSVHSAASALGQATLACEGTNLTIGNIGSSGQDGVAFAMDQAAGWAGHWQPLDPTDALPPGAYLQSEIIGTAGAAASGPLGSWRLTKSGSNNYAVTADFTPLGAATVTLKVYQGATLVTTLPGQSGALVSVNGCVDDDHWGNPTPTGPDGLPSGFGGALTFLVPRAFTFADGSSATGDRLVILPEGGAEVGSLTEARLLASGIPQITLDAEHITLRYSGLEHQSLGQAGLVAQSNMLTVYNLGSSGQDGVEIRLPAPTGRRLNVYYQAPAADGTLTFTGHGSTEAQAEQEVAKTFIAYADNTATLGFDYSSIGAATYTLRIYNGKQLVHESSGHPSGSACLKKDGFKYKQLPLDDVHMGWYEEGPEYFNGTFWVCDLIWHPGYTCDTMPGGQTQRVIGGPTVFGDLVVGIPENPTLTVGAASRFQLQASGQITTIRIGAATFSADPSSPVPYSVWSSNAAAATNVFGTTLGGPGDDDDCDGFNNLLEYAFGTNPFDSASGPLITNGKATVSAGGALGEYFTLSCERPADRAAIPQAQISEDLQSWASAVLISSRRQPNGRMLDIWRTPEPIHAKPRAMLRFKVTAD